MGRTTRSENSRRVPPPSIGVNICTTTCHARNGSVSFGVASRWATALLPSRMSRARGTPFSVTNDAYSNLASRGAPAMRVSSSASEGGIALIASWPHSPSSGWLACRRGGWVASAEEAATTGDPAWLPVVSWRIEVHAMDGMCRQSRRPPRGPGTGLSVAEEPASEPGSTHRRRGCKGHRQRHGRPARAAVPPQRSFPAPGWIGRREP